MPITVFREFVNAGYSVFSAKLGETEPEGTGVCPAIVVGNVVGDIVSNGTPMPGHPGLTPTRPSLKRSKLSLRLLRVRPQCCLRPSPIPAPLLSSSQSRLVPLRSRRRTCGTSRRKRWTPLRDRYRMLGLPSEGCRPSRPDRSRGSLCRRFQATPPGLRPSISLCYRPTLEGAVGRGVSLVGCPEQPCAIPVARVR